MLCAGAIDWIGCICRVVVTRFSAAPIISTVLQKLRWPSAANFRILLAALLPKITCDFERIDIALLPPLSFLAGGVYIVMVGGAQRNGELVAHLQA